MEVPTIDCHPYETKRGAKGTQNSSEFPINIRKHPISRISQTTSMFFSLLNWNWKEQGYEGTWVQNLGRQIPTIFAACQNRFTLRETVFEMFTNRETHQKLWFLPDIVWYGRLSIPHALLLNDHYGHNNCVRTKPSVYWKSHEKTLHEKSE